MGAALSTAGCTIASNPDIAGIGVRISVYGQNLLCFIPALVAIADGKISDYELESMETLSTTNLVVAFGILISCIAQALTLGLSSFHAAIVLSMSWTNNTNVFIYFLLYVTQLKGNNEDWAKALGNRAVSVVGSSFRNLFLSESRPPVRPKDTENGPASTLEQSDASRAPTTKFRRLFRRVTIVLGSLHLTLMSTLGIWLWVNPRAFGTSDSVCAVEHAHLAIAGAQVSFGSNILRAFSLLIYALFLMPGLNLIFPMALFLGLYFLHRKLQDAMAKPRPLPAPATTLQRNPSITKRVCSVAARIMSPKSPVFPAFVGLFFLLIVNIIFIVDIELTLKGNRQIQDSSEGEWGFGQVLAVLLLFLPLRDLVEMIFRRRQELQTQVAHQLRKAILDQDAEAIERWVNAGADIETQAENGHSALEAMIRATNLEGVRTVIKLNANVNAKFRDGTGALKVAALTGRWDMVSEIVNAGADVNTVFEDKTQALEVAILTRQWSLASEIIKVGAEVNTPFQDGKRALEVAILAKQWHIVSDIVNAGADVTIPFEDGATALEKATLTGQWSLVSTIVKAGADVNISFRDAYHKSALYTACAELGPQAVIELLIEKGADVNATGGERGETSLHVKCRDGKDDMVQLLLKHGANPAFKNQYGTTPLHFACSNGKTRCAEILLKHVEDPTVLANAKDKMEQTPLHDAYRMGQQECIKLLLMHGAGKDIKDTYGRTAAEWAPEGFELEP